ncbi:hypothetical protein [Klebsiella quasipneumoniae]
MAEEGPAPVPATIKAMGQVSGAIIGITPCCRRCSCRWPSWPARWG